MCGAERTLFQELKERKRLVGVLLHVDDSLVRSYEASCVEVTQETPHHQHPWARSDAPFECPLAQAAFVSLLSAPRGSVRRMWSGAVMVF